MGEKRYNVEVLCKVNAFAEDTLFSEKVLSSLIASKPIRTDFLKPTQVDEEGFPIDLSNFVYSNNEYDSDIGYIKNLWIWEDPIIDVEYGIAADVASGQKGDYSCFHVFNLETKEQVAEFNSNVVSTEIFKQIIWDVTIYYNKAKLSIESNSLGIAIVQWFVETKEYENFYFTRKSKNNYVPGFYVGANRGNIIASGVTTLEKGDIKLNSIRTINQARLFGYTKTGKLEGLNGTHDDLMLSLFQFCYLMEIFFNTSKVREIDENEEDGRKKQKEEQIQKHRLFNQEVYIDRDTKEFLDVMHSQGYSLPQEYLQEYMK